MKTALKTVITVKSICEIKIMSKQDKNNQIIIYNTADEKMSEL